MPTEPAPGGWCRPTTTSGTIPLIAAAADFQTRVGVEDLAILERMDDPVIALDLREEVHTKADLGTVEYRRLLSDVVDAAAARLLAEGAHT